MIQPHILVVTFPGQGHINPGIQFSKRLVSIGVKVTFGIPTSAHRRMAKTNIPTGLSFATFSDGYDDGYNLADDFGRYVSHLSSHGFQTFPQIITEANKQGHPFTCIVYSLLLPWVPKVARQFHLPSIFLWNQPATVFAIYYYYHHGYDDEIDKLVSGSSVSLNLPGLPSLTSSGLPSFFFPKHSKRYSFAFQYLKEDFQVLDEETNPTILINTFDELENSSLKSINKYKLIGIGPLIPSAFLDGKDTSDKSFGGDLFQGSKDHIEWLNTKPESSVIYVCFGSISAISEADMEQVVKALIDIDRPFLLVARENGIIGKKELMEEKGMIVPWCNQVEILSHRSVGCFVSHSGWNSTMEAIVSGVPMVALPQWSDQTTNSMMIEQVWKIGVRVAPSIYDEEEGILKAEEIKRCLNMVMPGTKQGQEMIDSANKWKQLARAAVKENGSSDRNLKEFLREIQQECFNGQDLPRSYQTSQLYYF